MADYQGSPTATAQTLSTQRILKLVLMVALGVAALTISAKIKVPFWPVPMTMQTGVVLLIGAAYGWRAGVATVVAYLALGAMGQPVFTNTPPAVAGPAYFMGPTGGFLMGFIASAFVAGWFHERGAGKSLVSLFGALLLANALVFVIGLAWLGQAVPALGYSWKLLEAGLLPFILGDLVKVALATVLIWQGSSLIAKLR